MIAASLNEIVTFLTAILLDLVVAMIIIQRLHASHLLTGIDKYGLLLFNMLILFLCFALSQLELSFGAGLGLFALLAILRFRSEVMKIDELIGLLLLLGLGFMHALFPSLLNLFIIVMIDIILVVITILMAQSAVRKVHMKIKMHHLHLLNLNNRQELKSLLEEKVGLTIQKIEVLNLNLEEDSACLNVTFYDQKQALGEKAKSIHDRFNKGRIGVPTLAQGKIS